jgi:hypothetical protein
MTALATTLALLETLNKINPYHKLMRHLISLHQLLTGSDNYCTKLKYISLALLCFQIYRLQGVKRHRK